MQLEAACSTTAPMRTRAQGAWLAAALIYGSGDGCGSKHTVAMDGVEASNEEEAVLADLHVEMLLADWMVNKPGTAALCELKVTPAAAAAVEETSIPQNGTGRHAAW